MRRPSKARAKARLGSTVVAVLHHLTLATSWADQIAAMKTGRVLAFGNPTAAFRNDFLSEVFGYQIWVNATPGKDLPFILPQPSNATPTHRMSH
jgi:iron complex transport system ATP-binding protein